MTAQSSLSERLLRDILFNKRWIFVIFLLPMSAMFNLLAKLRKSYIFWTNGGQRNHKTKVTQVQQQVRKWFIDHLPGERMCTAKPGWMTVSPRVLNKRAMRKIQIGMSDIVHVDEENCRITLEPDASIGTILHLLLPLGWTMAIVPELEQLSIGGLFNGIGIETSSHRFGLFKDIVEEFEIVVADGTLHKCNEQENTELFRAVPFGHGTLGFVVSITVKIIRAKPWVRLTYCDGGNDEVMTKKLKAACEDPNAEDFVEALVFSPTESVLMTGTMVAEAETHKINRIGWWWKPWFFTHVQESVGKSPRVEYIPLVDYYKRHARSIFWTIADIIPFGNSAWFRMLFGWLTPPNISLLKITTTETIQKVYDETQLIQDMLVPISSLPETLLYSNRHLQIYPLWICPYKSVNADGLLKPKNPEELFVDVGLYGTVHAPGYSGEHTTRALEEHVRKVKGIQMMYADCHQTRGEWAEMFDRTLYDKVRQSSGAIEAFPDVFDKTSIKSRK